VSGRWPFGSGCLHADHIVGGCLVYEGDQLVMDDEGRPEIRAVWLPRDSVVIHDTWRTTGMAGTGSNDYQVDDVMVPGAHGFHPFRPGPRTETLYRYQGFFLSNLGSVALGTAQRMVDDLVQLAQDKVLMPSFTRMKDEGRVQELLSEAAVAVGSARAYQDDRLNDVWDTLERGDELTRGQRAGVGLLGINAVQSALRASELVCDAVGSEAIYASSPFDRRRRDLVTMAAHVLGARKTYQMTGQLLLGADTPFSVF
jgi:alkylation response protein AidB-like acyl-CoA dehydrogenase